MNNNKPRSRGACCLSVLASHLFLRLFPGVPRKRICQRRRHPHWHPERGTARFTVSHPGRRDPAGGSRWLRPGACARWGRHRPGRRWCGPRAGCGASSVRTAAGVPSPVRAWPGRARSARSDARSVPGRGGRWGCRNVAAGG